MPLQSSEQLSPHLLHRSDYLWDTRDEPHLRRKMAMLEKYPQIQELFGTDHRTKYVIFLVVSLQLLTCYLVKDTPSWWIYCLVAYVIGGTLNHSCSAAIHETTHCVVFDTRIFNYLIAIFVNLPLGVPAAMSFKKYHHEHHIYQGVDGLDPDIPTPFECKWIRSRFAKLLNVVFMSLFYSLRALFIRPKPVTTWEVINIVCQLVFNAAIVKFWGWSAMGYLLLSTFLGLGLHPLTGQFLQEHYVTESNNQETYSYYGWCNYLLFNVGYHNEHHDFPRIPAYRLPELKKIAPEFYENLEYKKSYLYTLYEYIFTDGFSAYNRVKRTKEVRDQARKELFKAVTRRVTARDYTEDEEEEPEVEEEASSTEKKQQQQSEEEDETKKEDNNQNGKTSEVPLPIGHVRRPEVN